MSNFSIFQKFVEYLSSRGLAYTTASDTIINYNYKGLNYMFQSFQDTDPYYFRIMLPKVSNKPVDRNMLNMINTINRDYKAVKTVEFESGVIWLVLETFVYSMDGIDQLFTRVMETLEEVITIYRKKEAEL